MQTLRSPLAPIVFTLLSILLFNRCQKEEIFAGEQDAQDYMALAVNAEDFIDFFEADGDNFIGIFVKVSNTEVQFEKVRSRYNRFYKVELDQQPRLKRMVIRDNGEILEFNPDIIDEETVTPLPDDFDLCYFPWEELKLIANNSDMLYFSEAKISFGASIHKPGSINLREYYSMLKIEGDFKKASDSVVSTPTPMYLDGRRCPPFWWNGNS